MINIKNMKVVILAGGFGTRIAEESGTRPKPMVELGGHPILWHVMKIYSAYGINEFIICAGYKSEAIKDYFANYLIRKSDVTFDTKNGTTIIERNGVEQWKVTVVDTGLDSMTGGRLARVKKYIGNETFMMTYGDGVGDININELLDFHKKEGALATVTAVKTPGRFGAFILDPGQTKVQHFREKATDDGTRINAGFFVLEPEVFNYIENDQTVWEQEPLQRLSKEEKLAGFRHDGFWQPMDSLRDKNVLEEIWNKGNAPWKVWKN